MGATTVLVVDDHSGFRACARHLLEGEGYRVIGEAADGASAVTCARDLRPQVALVDVYLPDIDGFEVASRIKANGSAPAVVLTSSRDVTDLGPLAECPHVRGFIPKSELSGAALEALL
jgi:DNA-binding NarL/FixJ family response regulator